jgi:tRNA pseudouridine55 synthase
MDGVLIVDKPVGPTSHDIVARARRALGERRVGHTGTLDPAASGVLPLVVGRATRLARFLSAGDKSYDAVVRLGISTDTGDAEGKPIGSEFGGVLPTRDTIDAVLDRFRGRFLQQPPVYSAKKIDGHRSYRLARDSARRTQHTSAATAPPATSPRPMPVEVTAHSLVIVNVEGDRLVLRVECSAGFYVRSLAHDLGERLGTGAHLAGLRRTRSGDYRISQAIPLEAIEQEHDAAAAGFVPLASMLPRLSSVVLTFDGTRRARHGLDLGPNDLTSRGGDTEAPAPPAPPASSEAGEWVRLLGPEGNLVGLARPVAGSGLLHPSVVLI